jgi:phytoene dehydrogenase-like protein
VTYDAVVIGAGHNGLVCAAYLARSGKRVLALERRPHAGGLAQTVEIAPGFRAPAVLHTVERLRRSVVRDLGLEAHGLEVLRPRVRAFAPDPAGGGIVLHRDAHRTADGLRQRSPRDARAFPAFDARVRSVASFMAHLAAIIPPDLEEPSLSDALLGLRLGRSLRSLGTRAVRETLRAIPMPVADLVQDSLENDLLRGAVASRGVALTAMGPWTAGTACVLLMAASGGGGAAGGTAYARGGPGALSNALVRATLAAGAEVRTGAEVRAIVTSEDRATGVALASGEEVAARVVVSALDPKRTLSLVDPGVLGPTLVWRKHNLRAPGAVAKVNLALSEVPSFPGISGTDALTGRIVIAPDVSYLERAADGRKYGRMSAAPFLEITIPSLTDPSLVTGTGHVASVLVHFVPFEIDGRASEDRDRVQKLALDAIDGVAPGVSERVVGGQVLLPADLEREYGLTQGCIQHLEPGLDQFFAWRPMLGHARYGFVLPGLYLAGAGAHPGGGITGAPGANAARRILADLRSGPAKRRRGSRVLA